MKIQTKFLGEVEINEQDIYVFEQGVPGFEEYKKFAILAIDSDMPIAFLQCVEQQEIGFVISLPFAFKADYSFDLSEIEKTELKIVKEEDVLVYTIMTLNDPFSTSTINLLAPIVLNIKEKLGKQIVLADQTLYPLRYRISELEGSAK
jgi:flagellar assembly factor FliW